MKALSVKPWFAMPILLTTKTVECRSWQTDHRGDLLICSTDEKQPRTIPGHAICIAKLDRIEPFTEEHLYEANMEHMPSKPSYAWVFGEARPINPFPVKGKQRLFDVDDSLIEEVTPLLSDAIPQYYMPHVVLQDAKTPARQTKKHYRDLVAVLRQIEEENGLR